MTVSGNRKKKKDKDKPKFRISFVFLFIFASFVACFTLYMRSDIDISDEGDTTLQAPIVTTQAASSAVETESIALDDEGEIVSTAGINPIALCDDVGEEYLESCMFVGDSLVVGLSSYGIIPEDRVVASIGMSTMTINDTPIELADGTSMLACDMVNAAAPENLYILLGLNLMSYYTDEQLLAAYGDFVDSIDRTNTNIYVISVPPVTAAREEDEENPILNSDIDSFNSDLLKFANSRGLYYIDLNTALKGADGRFSEDDAEADGIHFKSETYTVMLEYIRTHVYNG